VLVEQGLLVQCNALMYIL